MSGSARRLPNIIIVLIDTLRADHLSCYGYPRRTSPSIDAIAEKSCLYERAISPAAWTPPAHASLFTGAYPSRHGVDRSHLVLDPDLIPLPELLRGHGYRTFGVSSNYWLSRETRFDRGFDEFVHSWQLVQTGGANAPLQRQQRRQDLGLGRAGLDRKGLLPAVGNFANKLFEKATKRLRVSFHAYDDGAWRVNHIVRRWLPRWKRDDRPFFAFVHYMEPHIRYAAPGRYHTMHVPGELAGARVQPLNQDPWKFLAGRVEMSAEDFEILRGLYDGEISYVDHRIGQLYGMLRDEGLLDDTALILTSDHGENLGDHSLMDHAYCLYDTLLQVPLIVHCPGVFTEGKRVGQQVQNLDIFPTILELAGVRDDGVWKQVQGSSLLNGAAEEGRVAFAEYLEPQPPLPVLRKRFPGFEGKQYDRTLRAVRTQDYKYVWASDGQHELYDLSQDAGEEHNVIGEQADKGRELRTALDGWLASFRHSARDQGNVELDEDMVKRLEELGYLA